MAPMSRPKVFCVGFQKTGTTSLNAALSGLGYDVASYWGGHLKYPKLKAVYIEECLKLAAKCDAVEDMPWPLLYRELDREFPGARFILTTRETDRWLKSICSHFGADPASLQMLTYGEAHPYPIGHEARYAAVYEAHNEAVRAYFRDRPGDLLEMDLTKGDGWDKLCPFIGVPVPDWPFPQSNSAGARESLRYRVVKRVRSIRRAFGGHA